MTAFAREVFSTALVNEMLPLFVAHHDEINPLKDIEPDLDVEMFDAVEKVGTLRIFTARDEKCALIGYAVFFVSRHPHFKTSKQALQDALFLSKTARKGMTGYRFIEFCDKSLADEGCQVIYQNTSIALDYGPILRRLGYKPVDKVYFRRTN